MFWQRMIRRDHRATPPIKRQQRRLTLEALHRRELLAADLGAIAGVAFVDEAGDGTAVGDPPVLVDGSGDLVSPGTPGAQGIQVQLFEDTNGDTQFDGGDLLIGTDITDADGNYRFDGLIAGRYFLQQQVVPQLNTPAAVTVDVTSVGGVRTQLIDDYSETTQSVTADAGTPTNTDFATTPISEVVGGARDIQVANSNNLGQVTVFVDSNSDTLSIGSLGDAVGTALLQYDGIDNSIALNATGLGGVSLAGGAAGATLDPGAGLIIQSRAENAGDTLFITVHSDGSNSSTISIPVPQEATNFLETFVLFSSFTTASGTGADFNNVGAIEASLGLAANNDVFVSIVESLRPDLTLANIPNILPLSLGGQLFFDNDQGGGQNNGLREGTEAGATGVRVDLYQLANATDVVDPTTGIPLASTTTGPGGVYNFPGLDPGHYAIVVPSVVFQPAATLFGFANSTGNDPASDPDDNVNNDDNGTTLASGDVVSQTITLASNNEPTNDGDDANTNSTLDFGFFPQIDLAVTKTLNVASSNVVAGGNAVFDIVVQNAGPLDATNVIFADTIPAGLTFTGTANPSGSFTTNVNGADVEVVLGTLPAGTTATFQILADVNANQTTDIVNTGTVTGTEVDIDLTNNANSANLDLIESDLRIEKTDASDPINAGDQLTYTLTVTNDGPDDAAGVVVVDPLPIGVTFVSGDVGGNSNLVNFNAGTNEVTATIGPLANGANGVVTITVAVDDNANSPLTNTATVTADPNTDPDASNNTATEETTVERLVDLEIDKMITGTPIAGQNVTYTVEVTNNGPSQARGVMVADTLQTGLTFVAGSFVPGTSGATITANGQDLTFDVPNLSSGQVATFTFDALIAPSAAGTIPNTASVSTTDVDSDTTNDADTVSVNVQREVDLILAKTVDLTTAVPGQDQLVYEFTVSHDTDSSSDAATVVITDTLPAGLTGALITAPGSDDQTFDSATGTVTVTYNTIPIGETRTFTVTSTVDETATGIVTNAASVTSVGTDLDSTNDSDSASTTLTPDFDVTVAKSVDTNTPPPTGTITYTVDISNTGPSSAPGVILSDVIPSGLTFVSGTLGTDVATSDGTTVTFPAITIASGTSQSATLIFTVDAAASGLITNTASVQDLSADGENDASNNAGAADITVTPEADLSISKAVTSIQAIAGSDLTYTIEVSNSGPSPATNVVVADTLPAGVTFVSGTGPNGETLTETGGVVNVSGGDVASGGTFSFTIDVTVASGATGLQTNSATVSSDTNDSDTSNNTATAGTTIDPENSSISGSVFVDRDDDGIQDAGEEPIAGVVLTLTGQNFLGTSVDVTVTTDANGAYSFQNLASGTYTVTETQPAGFRDGQETPGTFGPAAGPSTPATFVPNAPPTVSDNVFAEIGLDASTAASGFNFAELTEALSKRRFLGSTT